MQDAAEIYQADTWYMIRYMGLVPRFRCRRVQTAGTDSVPPPCANIQAGAWRGGLKASRYYGL